MSTEKTTNTAPVHGIVMRKGSRVRRASDKRIGTLSHQLHLDYWAASFIGEESPQAYHWTELSVVELPYLINCQICHRDHYANECRGSA
jgi:hypothetical protein